MLLGAFLLLLSAALFGVRGAAAAVGRTRPLCQENSPLCTEVADSLSYDGKYTGHDEPALLFYSNTPGSGHSNLYRLTLPKDPPTLPVQNGTRGTFNFQLRPAFSNCAPPFGSAWRCVMINRRRIPVDRVSVPPCRAHLTAIATSTRARPPQTRIISASIQGRRLWKCSSIRRAGSPGLQVSVAIPRSGALRSTLTASL